MTPLQIETLVSFLRIHQDKHRVEALKLREVLAKSRQDPLPDPDYYRTLGEKVRHDSASDTYSHAITAILQLDCGLPLIPA